MSSDKEISILTTEWDESEKRSILRWGNPIQAETFRQTIRSLLGRCIVCRCSQ